jgi:hypothetical protein
MMTDSDILVRSSQVSRYLLLRKIWRLSTEGVQSLYVKKLIRSPEIAGKALKRLDESSPRKEEVRMAI